MMLSTFDQELVLWGRTYADAVAWRKKLAQRFGSMWGESARPGDRVSALRMREYADRAKSLVARKAEKVLRTHPLWPWLSMQRGVRGPLVVQVLGLIGDPWRFPGAVCARGHVSSARSLGFGARVGRTAGGRGHPVGAAEIVGGPGVPPLCPIMFRDGEVFRACGALLIELRRGTGVRSLRHYAGLAPIGGKALRYRAGERASWNPELRALLLGPTGIVSQLLRHHTEPYEPFYRECRAKGYDHRKSARKVADRWLGDCLMAWKRAEGEG